ncbi:hypothetical protein IU474_28985 [Nocardia otitidiscaviarum]|uniref:hypothetical protein n=1 Tax=Nocardia otitidiscaviarum TaxID=1823 RepID=UPI001893E924|nr:hypothetical protein [Nocardia otitidiscaviarum]MBF6241085.1 hypothetical protein [Nocardia otitidiscaviarum]
MAGAAPLTLTVGTAVVPRSLTRPRPTPEPAAHDGVRLAFAAVAALSGAVCVVLIVRALCARTERPSGS